LSVSDELYIEMGADYHNRHLFFIDKVITRCYNKTNNLLGKGGEYEYFYAAREKTCAVAPWSFADRAGGLYTLCLPWTDAIRRRREQEHRK
jgi:hypothetical protein